MSNNSSSSAAEYSSVDLTSTDIPTFINLVNYNNSLNLTPKELQYSIKQLQDQWFSQAAELRSVDQQAFKFLDLPASLVTAINEIFSKLIGSGDSSIIKLKIPPAVNPSAISEEKNHQNGGGLAMPNSDSNNYSGTMSGMETDGNYQPKRSISSSFSNGHGSIESERKANPLPAVGEIPHENLDNLTAEMLADDDSDRSESSASHNHNHRSHSHSRSRSHSRSHNSASPEEIKSPGPSKPHRHKLKANGDSLMTLKRAVDHICNGLVREENTIRHLQNIIRQAMAESGKVTQGVLRDHLKRLQSIVPSGPAEEKSDELISQLSISNTKRCEICNEKSEKSFTLDCAHDFCVSCIKRFINDAVGQQRAVGIKCPIESCNRELSASNIQSLLLPEEFESYLQATLMAFIEQDEATFLCPNASCKALISVEPLKAAQPPNPMTENDEEGKPLSPEAWLHFREFRVRCRDCNFIFCAQCKHSPYHKGFTCSQFKEYQAARHCRFCSAKLDEENTWKDGKTPAMRDICTDDECQEKAVISCDKMLACGCPCGGVKDEVDCLPCLKHDLDCAEEFCSICYIEALGVAPVIKLDGPCTHMYHFACVKSKLEAKWPGARISFDFRSCPVCKQTMNHKSLESTLAPILALESSIIEKAVERLKYEVRDKDPAVVNKNGEYYNDPVRFAMKLYVFHICFKCTKPYFAGGYQCQEANQAFDPAELICPGCQPQSVNDCLKHGKDWLTYKCKFCCNVASYWCWGNSHFCASCHKSGVWQTLSVFRTGKNKRKLWEYDNCAGLDSLVKAIGKDSKLTEEQKDQKIEKLLSDPKTCPLSCRHPPAGFEFGLGCSMCEDSHSSAEKLKETEAVVRAKLTVVKNELMKNGAKLFLYASDFDGNGVVAYLATCGRTAQYCNPAEAGFIRVSSSGMMGDSAPLAAAVGKEVVRCVTAPVKNSWFCFEILDLQLCLTHYTLRHYNSWDTEALRNWVLEGSNDGSTWELLCVHVNDQSLNRKGATRTWQVESRGKKYRMFRILQNGRNSNNNYYLALSGLELYGSLTVADAKSDNNANLNPPMPLQVPMPQLQPASRPAAVFPGGDLHVRTCVFHHDLDQNGLMYWLGSRFGMAKTWSNPAEMGLVRVSCSDLATQPVGAPISAVVGREVVRCVSASLPNMWFVIDITPSGKRIRPTHYTLRHYISWDLEALRNWRFEASVNGTDWFVLSVHVNDTALDRKGATHTWALPNCQSAFGLFRVWQTGFNSNNHHYLALSGFEIYGDVFDVPQFSGPQFAPQLQQLPIQPPQYQPSPIVQPGVSPLGNADSSLINFRYSHDFDSNGLFFWLGTAGKRQQWQNPAEMGLVNVQCSALAVNPPSAPTSAIVGRETVRCVSLPKPEMWFLIDLKDKQFFVTHYTLRHYISWDTEALRNWRFEGSNDGSNWEILRTHTGDAALNKKGSTHTWQISAPQNRLFRMFRIFQFGPNSNNNHYLSLSGVEFYGGLKMPGVPQGKPQPQPIAAMPPPAYAAPPMQQRQSISMAPVQANMPRQQFQEFKEGQSFIYHHDFDENGIFYWLGTNQYRQPWQNPGQIGAVRVSSVPLAIDPPSEPAHAIVGRSVVRCVTMPNRESWFCVDLVNWWVRPTHYSLRHYSTWDTEAIRDWKLQASNDGKKWTKLTSHKKDEALNAKGSTSTWAIPKCKKGYSMFRILLTGKNSNGHYFLACSGFELYGQVFSFKC